MKQWLIQDFRRGGGWEETISEFGTKPIICKILGEKCIKRKEIGREGGARDTGYANVKVIMRRCPDIYEHTDYRRQQI